MVYKCYPLNTLWTKRCQWLYLLNGMQLKDVSAKPGRPRSFDTEKALGRAMEVFWRKGYLGTSLFDLTKAMRINRPSLYSAFGNKRSLFRKTLKHYSKGPSAYLGKALKAPTARAVAEQLLFGVIELLTAARAPGTCLWVHGALSCGDDPIGEEFASQRAAGHDELRARFQRAIVEGDLPRDTDATALAQFVQTINFGLTVQASTGATREELLRVVAIALKAWPN
jgi:AcrR family transcriptional regulator